MDTKKEAVHQMYKDILTQVWAKNVKHSVKETVHSTGQKN